MADVLKDASDWLGSMFIAHASRSVVYARGGDSVTLVASVGRTVHEVMNNLGIIVATESRDFIVTAADIEIDGSVVEPRSGDRITDTQGSVDYVYEVMPFGKDSRTFRYCDADHSYLRIHTKEVDRN